jgi:hypothetical protein
MNSISSNKCIPNGNNVFALNFYKLFEQCLQLVKQNCIMLFLYLHTTLYHQDFLNQVLVYISLNT